mmetsp:Transcript_23602/g.52311  ORF Transcript_23602/g.52311 Transcript_23602/m.52311 type:complete len:220 (+) Transcript_23602:158-817(+)
MARLHAASSHTFYELVNDNRPGAIHVIVRQVGFHLRRKVIQHHPCVLGDRILHPLLNESYPLVQQRKVLSQQELPELHAHVCRQASLALVQGKLEGEGVNLLTLCPVSEHGVELRQLRSQSLRVLTAELRHTSNEFLPCENAHMFRVTVVCDHQRHGVQGANAEVGAESLDALRTNAIVFSLVFTEEEVKLLGVDLTDRRSGNEGLAWVVEEGVNRLIQ